MQCVLTICSLVSPKLLPDLPNMAFFQLHVLFVISCIADAADTGLVYSLGSAAHMCMGVGSLLRSPSVATAEKRLLLPQQPSAASCSQLDAGPHEPFPCLY